MNQGRPTNGGNGGADDYFNIKSGDVVIAVMGMTGVGKSTFINHFSERRAPVGLTLESCTGKVDVYKCSDYKLGSFWLVDSPGFDDTFRSDTEILSEVSAWLSRAYQEKIWLTGIIYLHRIYDNRLGGKAMKNLRSFQKLCGSKAMSKVVLATTFWGVVDQDTELKREIELKTKPDFWGGMISNGTRVFRQDNEKISAREIISYLINNNKGKPGAPVAIQEQMVDQGMNLEDTDAGKEMNAELQKERAMYEKKLDDLRREFKDALLAKDVAWQQEIKKEQDERKKDIAKADADRKKLAADNADLQKRLDKQIAMDDPEMKKMRDMHQELIIRLQYQLKVMESENASNEEKQRLRDQVREEKNKRDMLMWKIRQSQARCVVM